MRKSQHSGQAADKQGRQEPDVLSSHVGVEIKPFLEEYLVKPVLDEDGVMSSSGIGLDGKEYGDSTPMSPPIGYTPPNDLMTMIQTMIKHEKAKEVLDQNDLESEEEANDFDIEDDPLDVLTPYEKVFEPPPAEPAAALAAISSAAQPGAPAPGAPTPAPDSGSGVSSTPGAAAPALAPSKPAAPG